MGNLEPISGFYDLVQILDQILNQIWTRSGLVRDGSETGPRLVRGRSETGLSPVRGRPEAGLRRVRGRSETSLCPGHLHPFFHSGTRLLK